MADAVTQAWHDQAQRSLDAMHARAERAENNIDSALAKLDGLIGELRSVQEDLGDDVEVAVASVLKRLAEARAALARGGS